MSTIRESDLDAAQAAFNRLQDAIQSHLEAAGRAVAAWEALTTRQAAGAPVEASALAAAQALVEQQASAMRTALEPLAEEAAAVYWQTFRVPRGLVETPAGYVGRVAGLIEQDGWQTVLERHGVELTV